MIMILMQYTWISCASSDILFSSICVILMLLYSRCQMDIMQYSIAICLELRQPDGIYCRTTYVK